MRIGIDVRLWNETGVGRYIRNLVVELSHIDDKNSYILFARTDDIANIKNQIAKKNFSFIPVDIRWHSFSEQFQFPKLLNSQNLDLVHFPYFSVPIYYKKPYIVTIHDVILHHFPTGQASTLPLPFYKLKYRGYKYVIETAAKQARRVITVTNATKDEVMQTLGVASEKIVVTYEGIDEGLESRIKNQESRIIKEKYFLHVGNLYPHKNIPRLLEAFKEVVVVNPEYKLVFVGKHDYFTQKMVEYVHRRDLEDHITFLGHVSDSDLRNLYYFSEGVVIPSLMEGFGLPAIEGMQQKTLILASDIPALKEVCGEAALYFDPNSAHSIAECINSIIEKGKNSFSKNIKNGEEQIRQFSWKEMAEKTLEVYENCFK